LGIEMQARIYRPAKPAVSSGRYKSRLWLLEFEPQNRQEPDRLMGWIGSGDTDRQVTLRFATKEAAVAYGERRGIAYSISDPHTRIVRPKAYADNFIRRV
jgi:hypothetical protein